MSIAYVNTRADTATAPFPCTTFYVHPPPPPTYFHRPGKRVNFSIVYGAGKRQVAAELGLGQKEAGAILDK